MKTTPVSKFPSEIRYFSKKWWLRFHWRHMTKPRPTPAFYPKQPLLVEYAYNSFVIRVVEVHLKIKTLQCCELFELGKRDNTQLAASWG